MRVFGLLPLFLSLPLFASTEITTQIHDIDYGQSPKDDVLVLLTSGHVAKLNQSSQFLYQKSVRLEKNKTWFKIRLDDDRYIMDLEPVETTEPVQVRTMEKSASAVNFTYVPTTIADMNTATSYHRKARHSPKDSQCFNRGQVWTYEMWRNHSVKSNKIWIYFSRTYIRRYNFEWWFHIAPLVNVMHEGKVVERVMDSKYSRGPLDLQRWSNIFMRNNAVCNVITKFSDYADYPYTGECYYQRSNMYVYQPADLQMNEAWNYTKTNWNMDEVRGAYLEAFDIRL